MNANTTAQMETLETAFSGCLLAANRKRTTAPTWEEMCEIKRMFFQEDETVVEYHPAKADYVNLHPLCLHMWRPIGAEMPKPPKIFV